MHNINNLKSYFYWGFLQPLEGLLRVEKEEKEGF